MTELKALQSIAGSLEEIGDKQQKSIKFIILGVLVNILLLLKLIIDS